MIKHSVTLLLVFLCAWNVQAQVTASTKATVAVPEGPVNWLTIEEAIEKSKTEKRPIFIDVFTTWCGYCKVMDKETFSEAQIAKLLNEKYYPVKFDAEQKADVVFRGATYKFISDGGGRGGHQFAATLLDNQMSYPTVVFLDSEMKVKIPIPGYRKPPEFHKFLLFFSVEQTKNITEAWKEFEKTYKSPY